MKTIKKFATLAIISVATLTACNKSDDAAPTPNKQVIPVQSTLQPVVPMGTTSAWAILAGSAITSTGATNVTGDIGLSPGTSVGGFPPGILIGTQHINDPAANQAKVDLTAVYNDLAGRTSTNIVTLSGNIGGTDPHTRPL